MWFGTCGICRFCTDTLRYCLCLAPHGHSSLRVRAQHPTWDHLPLNKA